MNFESTKKNELILEEISKYLEQLDNVEKKILETAKTQLRSSFDINKSIGFLEWKKNMS